MARMPIQVGVPAYDVMPSLGDMQRKYLDVIDKFRQFGVEDTILIPEIAVIGEQSAGKSSVLESILQTDLPRGPGMVTRCPHVMQFRRGTTWMADVTMKNPDGTEYKTDIMYPDQVGATIMNAQKRLVKDNEISSIPIIVRIESPQVPDLTLVDLPGLVAEMPAAGPRRMDAGTANEIENLCKSYIKKATVTILVVLPGNTDIAASKALQIAAEQDSDGKRTIGVVTKIDMVPRGGEEQLIRMSRDPAAYKLGNGVYFVRLRSVKELMKRKSLTTVLTDERMFFNKLPWSVIEKDKCGVVSLCNRLAKELCNKVKAEVPRIRSNLYREICRAEDALKKLTEKSAAMDAGKGALKDLVSKSIHIFMNTARRMAYGNYRYRDKLDYHFLVPCREKVDEFAKAVAKTVPVPLHLGLQEVQRALDETRGNELPGFLNTSVYRVLVHKKIYLIEPHANTLLDATHDAMRIGLKALGDETFQQYPTLYTELEQIIDDALKDCRTECRKDLKRLLRRELMVIMPDAVYLRFSDKFAQKSREMATGQGRGQRSPSQGQSQPTSTTPSVYDAENSSQVNQTRWKDDGSYFEVVMKNEVQGPGSDNGTVATGLSGDNGPPGDGGSQAREGRNSPLPGDMGSAGEQDKRTLATAIEPETDDKKSRAGGQASARGQSFDEQMKPEPEVVDVRWKVAAYLESFKIGMMRSIPMCVHDYMIDGFLDRLEEDLTSFCMTIKDLKKYFVNTPVTEIEEQQARVQRLYEMQHLIKTLY